MDYYTAELHDDDDDDDDSDDGSEYEVDLHQVEDPHQAGGRSLGGRGPGGRGGIRRMTSISQLRTMSYCGRGRIEEDQELHHKHEVYSLPIVMTDEEWEYSSIEDKSFVLIHNTALCNHLWGMELLISLQQSQSPQQLCQHTIETCERAFNIAKSLYKLTIENVSSEIIGVDTMCYVALFNNISHVCKTLTGLSGSGLSGGLYNNHNCNFSQESYHYDVLLLKAIYWWKYNIKQTSQTQTDTTDNNEQQATASTATSSTTVMMTMDVDIDIDMIDSQPQEQERINNNMGTQIIRTSNSYYADNDIHIIDSFLENVFYLIGAQSTVVPASAA